MRVKPPVRILVEEQTVKGHIVVSCSEGRELWRAAQDIHKLRRMDLAPLETAVRDALPLAVSAAATGGAGAGTGVAGRGGVKRALEDAGGEAAADDDGDAGARPKKESRKDRKKREQQERYDLEVASLHKET